jgi:hypothetical protein
LTQDLSLAVLRERKMMSVVSLVIVPVFNSRSWGLVVNIPIHYQGGEEEDDEDGGMGSEEDEYVVLLCSLVLFG